LTNVIPAVAAGVIIWIPPGGNLGSIAVVLVEFFEDEPDTVPVLLADDPEFDVEPDEEPVIDAELLVEDDPLSPVV
jgi:hypothetical protein